MGNVGTTDELARRTGIARGNVSHTLRSMMAAGRVSRRPREGRRVPYELLR